MRSRSSRALWSLLVTTCLVAPMAALSSCDALEESLDGVAAPLKEPELPNCSRVLTCCANLDRQTLMPDSVKQACDGLVTPTDTVIEQYKAGKLRIQQDQATSAETKADLLAELKKDTQTTMEPACRCLLEETVGLVSLDDFLAPKDCETVTTSGVLPEGAQCDDVTGVIKQGEQQP